MSIRYTCDLPRTIKAAPSMMKSILFLAVASALMLSGCGGFKPVKLEHDDKEPPFDYKQEGNLPKNS